MQAFGFWTHFWKIKKVPFQDDHSKSEFLECCLKYADDPPGWGGRSPPPRGDPCILSQPRNSNFEWSSWKRTFLIFQKCVQNPKSCIYSHCITVTANYRNRAKTTLNYTRRGTITTTIRSGGRGRWGNPFSYYSAVAFAGTKKRRPKT